MNEVLNKTEGKLFALFNNGGFGQPGAVEDLRRDVLREQFETNVFGYLELTNLILPTMRKQGYGRIIQSSSILGFISLPFRGAYTASKHALEGLSDTLRMELTVRVHRPAVCCRHQGCPSVLRDVHWISVMNRGRQSIESVN